MREKQLRCQVATRGPCRGNDRELPDSSPAAPAIPWVRRSGRRTEDLRRTESPGSSERKVTAMLHIAVAMGTGIATMLVVHDLQAFAERYVARKHEND